MKKIAIILAMVCFVLSLSFAQEDLYKPSVTVSGNAKLKIGFNLESSTFGWLNTPDASLKITFVPKTTKTKGEGDAYGWIELKEFKIEEKFEITAPKISAKLVFGPMFVQFMDESNATKDFKAGDYALITLKDFDADVAGPASTVATAGPGNYLYVGYDQSPVALTVKAATTNDYCAGTGDDVFWFGAYPKLTLGDLTVEASSLFAANVDGFRPAFGVKASYKMPLTDAISLEPAVGFDMKLAGTTGGDAAIGIGGGLYAIWGGKTTWALNLKPVADRTVCNTWDDDKDIQNGAGVGFSYEVDGPINLVVQAVDGKGDDGIIPGLGFAAAFEIGNVAEEARTMAAKAMVSYKAGDLDPYAAIRWNEGTGSIQARVGIDVANVLPNTALNFEYNSPELGDLAGQHNGVVQAVVTVSF